MAAWIDAVAKRDSSAVHHFLKAKADEPDDADGDSTFAISCGDTFARADTLQDALAMLKPFRSDWSDVGDDWSLACARWPYAAKERYDGDFHVKTKNPMLVVSNTWDPTTPLSSAKNVSSGFEGSVLLEQRGYGHTSQAQASLCTTRRIRDYFQHGMLPAVGTVCAVDEPFFPEDYGESSWARVLESLAKGSARGTTIIDE